MSATNLNLNKNNLITLELRELLRKMKNHHHLTYAHSLSVARISSWIAHKINFSPAAIELIFLGALLHDVGKIQISTTILDKPAKLTTSEWNIIKKHPEEGLKILNHYRWADNISSIVKYHHERFDGGGYYGLSSTEIPLESRIVCIADAIDAMISPRPYQKPRSLSECWKEIHKNSGSQFDPKIVSLL